MTYFRIENEHSNNLTVINTAFLNADKLTYFSTRYKSGSLFVNNFGNVDVLFDAPFANNNYTIMITPSLLAEIKYITKESDKFIIATNNACNIDWIAILNNQ